MTLALSACASAALALVLLGLTGPAYRIGLLSLAQALMLLRWAGYAGAAALAAGLLAGLLAYRRGARLRTLIAAAAMLGAAIAVVIPLETLRRYEGAPPIHDVTTDLENPPTFEAIVPLRSEASNSLERSPAVSAEQRRFYPDLAPITLPVPPDQAFGRALALAQEAGWTIVTADRGSGRIEATAATRWFGFADDIVVRLTPWGSGTRVDIRASAREERTDAGRNARRIRRFLRALQSS
ncbi:MAG: DUF1499 domain-containing protein [Acidobacteria bacterium]|nr:DUF1499 domain-containing protein [Acidobacteriota bacterium]